MSLPVTPNKSRKKMRLKDHNAPRKPTTSFNFFMKHKSAEYIANNNLEVPDVIRLMSSDWHKMTPEERKPYDDASLEARKEYERQLAEYKQSDEYLQFQRMKAKVDSGAMDVSEMPKAIRTSSKPTVPVIKPSRKRDLAASKLGFPVFTEQFLNFNRVREEAFKKLRRNVGNLEEHIEDTEERIEKLAEKRALLRAERHEAAVVSNQARKSMERYRRVLLSSMPPSLREKYGLALDSDVQKVVDVLRAVAGKPADQEQFKKCVSGLKFN